MYNIYIYIHVDIIYIYIETIETKSICVPAGHYQAPRGQVQRAWDPWNHLRMPWDPWDAHIFRNP